MQIRNKDMEGLELYRYKFEAAMGLGYRCPILTVSVVAGENSHHDLAAAFLGVSQKLGVKDALIPSKEDYIEHVKNFKTNNWRVVRGRCKWCCRDPATTALSSGLPAV